MTGHKTIKEISEAWARDKSNYVKESTMAVYWLSLKNHIVPHFGSRCRFTEEEIQSFALEKLQGGLSQKSVKDMLVVVKMIQRYGERQGWLEHAEWQVRYPANPVKSALPILTKADQKRLMEHIEGHFTFLNLGIFVCLHTGMRIGEVCALRWSDFDLNKGVVAVSRTLERIYVVDAERPYTKVIEGSPKTKNSVREIPLSKDLMRMLRPLAKIVNPDYYVLTNESRPTEPRTYRNYFNELTRRLGIPHLKFHGLRHSFATRCIESRCDYKTVSVLLGHADIGTTLNLYVHPNDDQKRSCINQMVKSLK